jgi:hypothetical protein
MELEKIQKKACGDCHPMLTYKSRSELRRAAKERKAKRLTPIAIS